MQQVASKSSAVQFRAVSKAHRADDSKDNFDPAPNEMRLNGLIVTRNLRSRMNRSRAQPIEACRLDENFDDKIRRVML